MRGRSRRERADPRSPGAVPTLRLRPLDTVLAELSAFTLFGYWVDFVPSPDVTAVTTVHQVLRVGDRIMLSEATGQPQLLGGPVAPGEHPDGCATRFTDAAHLTLVGTAVPLGLHEPVRRFGQLPPTDGRPVFRVQWRSGRAVVADLEPPRVVRTLHPVPDALELLREVNPLHALVLEYDLHHRVG